MPLIQQLGCRKKNLLKSSLLRHSKFQDSLVLVHIARFRELRTKRPSVKNKKRKQKFCLTLISLR